MFKRGDAVKIKSSSLCKYPSWATCIATFVEFKDPSYSCLISFENHDPYHDIDTGSLEYSIQLSRTELYVSLNDIEHVKGILERDDKYCNLVRAPQGKSIEEHKLEMFGSLVYAINCAGGNFEPEELLRMSLLELIDNLAQNGIRFIYVSPPGSNLK